MDKVDVNNANCSHVGEASYTASIPSITILWN